MKKGAICTFAIPHAPSCAVTTCRDTMPPKLMWGEIRVKDAEKIADEATA
jgi:hypothetical protein